LLFGKFQNIQTAVDLLSEFEHHTPVIILITCYDCHLVILCHQTIRNHSNINCQQVH